MRCYIMNSNKKGAWDASKNLYSSILDACDNRYPDDEAELLKEEFYNPDDSFEFDNDAFRRVNQVPDYIL